MCIDTRHCLKTGVILVTLGLMSVALCQDDAMLAKHNPKGDIVKRAFRMGLTPFPYDMTLEALSATRRFLTNSTARLLHKSSGAHDLNLRRSMPMALSVRRVFFQ